MSEMSLIDTIRHLKVIQSMSHHTSIKMAIKYLEDCQTLEKKVEEAKRVWALIEAIKGELASNKHCCEVVYNINDLIEYPNYHKPKER